MLIKTTITALAILTASTAMAGAKSWCQQVTDFDQANSLLAQTKVPAYHLQATWNGQLRQAICTRHRSNRAMFARFQAVVEQPNSPDDSAYERLWCKRYSANMKVRQLLD